MIIVLLREKVLIVNVMDINKFVSEVRCSNLDMVVMFLMCLFFNVVFCCWWVLICVLKVFICVFCLG